MRIADYLIKTLADRGLDTVFLVTGGMAMHLNDALAGESRFNAFCCHHEQAASFAAEGYGHITGKPALVCVTAGPGTTNVLSGVYSAYVDSLPMVILAGQAKRELIRSTYNFTQSLRQIGEQEVDSVALATPLTKYAVRVSDPERIRFELEKALFLATNGRPGPVWLEIPLDVQTLEIDPISLPSFKPYLEPSPDLTGVAQSIITRFEKSLRPLIVAGPGVGEEGATSCLETIAKNIGCPLVGAGPQDAVTTDNSQYAGILGSVGTRAGNINVQNADLLLFVGMHCYLQLVTYNWQSLGRNAHKILIENDPAEAQKPCQIADEIVIADTKRFLSVLSELSCNYGSKKHSDWLADCKKKVALFPPVLSSMRSVLPDGRINPYWFIEELFSRLSGDDVIVAGNASSVIVPIQAGGTKKGQRFFSNIGCGAMGFGLPAAIGAAVASGGKRTISLVGDGSVMMNLQELQTIVHHQLPILLVILENSGYVSIRQTQRNYFNREIGSGPESGVSFPDFAKLAQVFGLQSFDISGSDFKTDLDMALSCQGPAVIVAHLDPDQPFEPKVASRRLPNGQLVSSSVEDMSPLLPRDELNRLLVHPLESDQ
jgi:acetolactate synthase-1/2/3 large subunit